MSTPSPLQPQGALEEAASPKSRVRITVLTILALHVVVIGGLLLQGCDKRPSASASATNSPSLLPPLNTDSGTLGGYPGDGGGSATPAPANSFTGAGSAGGGGGGSPLDGSVPVVPYTEPAAPAAGSGGFASVALPPLTPGTMVAPGGQPTEHVIRRGDMIGDLARKYGVTQKAIFEANPQVNPRNLRIDEKLIIPAPAPVSPAVAGGSVAASAGPGAGEVYVVKPGDTLGKIAKQFGVSVKALRAENQIKGDRIVPKQKLKIPARSTPTAASASRSARQI